MKTKAGITIMDHWKPGTLFGIIIIAIVAGLMTGTLEVIVAGTVLTILLSLLFLVSNMLYCFVFLMFKGISDKSTNIKYSSILPWLKFTDRKGDNHWKTYVTGD